MLGKQIKHLSGLFLLASCFNTAMGQLAGDVDANRLSLGRVLPGQLLEQVVTFNNPTGMKLAVENVQFMQPLAIRKITPIIEANGQGEFILTLDEKGGFGEFESLVRINFDNKDVAPIDFIIAGFIVPPIEFRPGNVLHVVTQRGKEKRTSLEIINHMDQPLRLTGIDYESERFTAALHTINTGKHYKLDLHMNGQGDAGRESEEIIILNNDKSLPLLKVIVNTLLREKVYTFPESVDLGTLPLNIASNANENLRLTQTLMIYKLGAKNFEIDVETGLDNIKLSYERGPEGDRYQLGISLIPGKLTIGPVRGSIIINTNDHDFPMIKVPVSGEILPATNP